MEGPAVVSEFPLEVKEEGDEETDTVVVVVDPLSLEEKEAEMVVVTVTEATAPAFSALRIAAGEMGAPRREHAPWSGVRRRLVSIALSQLPRAQVMTLLHGC